MWRVAEISQSAAEYKTLTDMFSTLMCAGETAIGDLYILIGKVRNSSHI